MTWQKLLDPDIQKFIRENEDADLARLALQKPPNDEWDMKSILDQIKSRQKARTKIPKWLGEEDVIFPAPDVMEQASSTATALYKATLANGQDFCDLTGGAGVDSWAFSKKFKTLRIVEKNEDYAALLEHNLKALSSAQIEVHNSCAEDFTADIPNYDLITIDPMRRNNARKGRFKFEDCSPNILEILPRLLEKTKTVMIKTSPMLDIAEGIKQLGCVNAVHIVEWQGDCKELVFLCSKTPEQNPIITAVDIGNNGNVIKSLSFTEEQEKNAETTFSDPKTYLYEPGPAFQKSGAFKIIAKAHHVEKLAPHTHLYTSDSLKPDFPGKIYEILATYPVQAKALPIKKANLKIRNFPMRVDDLKRKLKVKDGGEDTLFACTLKNGQRTLIHGRKTQ